MIIFELISMWLGIKPKSSGDSYNDDISKVRNYNKRECGSLYEHYYRRSHRDGPWYSAMEVVRCHAEGSHSKHYIKGTLLDVSWTDDQSIR